MTRSLVGAVRFVVIAALGATLTVLIGVAGGSLHWAFDLVGQFLLPATVVVIAATVMAGMFRWWRIAGAAALLAIVTLAVAWPWTMQPPAVAKDAGRFKVLLFNVWWRNWHVAEVEQMAAQSGADILVFIETTDRIRNELSALNSIYPYKLNCLGTGRCDIVIFSRARLTPVDVSQTSDSNRSPFVTAETDVAGCRLTLIATHMTRPFPNQPYSAQREQAREIAANVGSRGGAKLVVGDFNAAPWSYIVQTIAQHGAMQVLTGDGGTWPSILPPQLRIPIDNMIASDGLSFVSRRVLPRAGSDHLPVLGEIAVTDPAKCQ
jgi:endonuclease/exonuclease/phosphatase (EEP) superfamily protein YafD